MEYTTSVSMEVVQENGKTVYSDFNVVVNGDEEDELLEQLYGEMLEIYEKWKKRRIR